MIRLTMKILLVYPPCLEDRIHGEDAAAVPIGLSYIGAFLRDAGYAVEVINGQLMRGRTERFRAILEAHQPDVVGFSILQANRWGGIEMAEMVKAFDPKAVTVFGGVSASVLWRHFLTHFDAVDYVVVGEGEQPFLNLVRRLDAGGRGADLSQIPGLAWRENGRPRRNDCPDPIADLDALPQPSRYFDHSHVALTRGCPAGCRFCGSPDFWGRRVRFHSAGYFVGQLEMLSRRGVSFFYVSDDTFTVNRRRAIAVCREIIDRELPITWAAISRVDAVDGELLSWMRRAGCIQISYGVESGSPDIRKWLGKDFSDESIEAAFRETCHYGILPRAYFIYGCPGESDRSIQATLDLIERIRPLSAIFYILDLFPGTALYQEFCRRTGADDDIWLERIEDIPYFETDPALSREVVLGFGRRLRNGFHRMLPAFARNLSLTTAPEFRPLNADFLSRLGMTFHRGEYAQLEEIPDARAVAEGLYMDALEWHPNPRAYLGLGLLSQERRRFAEAETFLAKGLEQFPDDRELAVCMALCHMNTGRFEAALTVLEPIEGNSQVAALAAECRNRIQTAT